ncbi:MAG TPA: hypothetical protein VK184_26955 [Nostocaceae cyanobacterium]|nr:hypothetical protein [Nostocaceae cyanobacterium]
MKEKSREARGRIPKNLKATFEIACICSEVTQAAVLEEVIRDRFQNKDYPAAFHQQGY